jgi:hypothetical protein
MTAGSSSLATRADRLRSEAQAFVEEGAAARSLTTPGIERAALRFLGIGGLDHAGNPLASALVERFHDAGLAHLGDGIALALALAAAGRGTTAQETALAVADGEIDIATEAAFLQHPDRRAVAEALLGTWRDDAFDRIDANRTARHELDDTLGIPGEPWRVARLGAFRLDDAIAETRTITAAGADGILVRVPRGRELVAGLGDGLEERLPADLDPPPAGSQRGLASLRAALDELAAERGSSLILATVTEGLAAPEQAVVAAFERIDVVFADPFDELALGVEPDRAFADLGAAYRLLARSGTTVAVGPGPLLVGPELRRGESVGIDVRVGRSIAAQAVAVAWAAASGIDAERIVVQAPFEVPTIGADATTLAAELLVRRSLARGQPMAISQPAGSSAEDWRVASAVGLLVTPARFIVVPGAPDGFAEVAAMTTTAALVGDAFRPLASEAEDGTPNLSSDVMDAAGRLVEVALQTLRAARSEGWDGLVGSDVLATQDAARRGRAGILPAGGAAPWFIAAEEGA